MLPPQLKTEDLRRNFQGLKVNANRLTEWENKSKTNPLTQKLNNQ